METIATAARLAEFIDHAAGVCIARHVVADIALHLCTPRGSLVSISAETLDIWASRSALLSIAEELDFHLLERKQYGDAMTLVFAPLPDLPDYMPTESGL